MKKFFQFFQWPKNHLDKVEKNTVFVFLCKTYEEKEKKTFFFYKFNENFKCILHKYTHTKFYSHIEFNVFFPGNY